MVISTLRPFRCGYCSTWWPTVDVLNRHIRRHQMIHSRKTSLVKSYTSHHGTKIHRRKPPHRIQISEHVRSNKSSVSNKECTDQMQGKNHVTPNSCIRCKNHFCTCGEFNGSLNLTSQTSLSKGHPRPWHPFIVQDQEDFCGSYDTHNAKKDEISNDKRNSVSENLTSQTFRSTSHPYIVLDEFFPSPDNNIQKSTIFTKKQEILSDKRSSVTDNLTSQTFVSKGHPYIVQDQEDFPGTYSDAHNMTKKQEILNGKSSSMPDNMTSQASLSEGHPYIQQDLGDFPSTSSDMHNSTNKQQISSSISESLISQNIVQEEEYFNDTYSDIHVHTRNKEEAISNCKKNSNSKNFAGQTSLSTDHTYSHIVPDQEHLTCNDTLNSTKKEKILKGNRSSVTENLTPSQTFASKGHAHYLQQDQEDLPGTYKDTHKATKKRETSNGNISSIPDNLTNQSVDVPKIHLIVNGDVCATKKTMEQSTERNQKMTVPSSNECQKTESNGMESSEITGIVELFECPVCNKVFSNHTQRDQHHHKAHPAKYGCSWCKDFFRTEQELTSHEKGIHKCVPDMTSFACEYCEKSFCSKLELREHVKEHKLHSCEICGKSWSTRHLLILHKRCHKPNSSKRPTPTFKCTNCGEKYNQKSELEAHRQREHWNKLPYSCDQCSKSFGRKDTLKRHVITKHTPGGKEELNNYKKFLCSICGKRFPRLAKLNKHRDWVHLGKRQQQKHDPSQQLPSLCSHCGKTYADNKLLSSHIAYAHSAPKPKIYKCTECDKSFTIKSTLNRHLLVHLNTVKSYSCDVCGKSYMQNEYLKKHKKRHSTEMPYSCSFCDKKFPYLYHLKSHERTHRGICDYACTKCDASFVHSNSLTWHMKSKHANGAS